MEIRIGTETEIDTKQKAEMKLEKYIKIVMKTHMPTVMKLNWKLKLK